MHPYATDSNERRNVLYGLAGISIAVTWGIFRIFAAINFSPPWWLEAPSLASLYGLLYTAFDKWGWKIPILRKIGVIKVPDISGVWKGHLTSSYDDHKKRMEASIHINQTWTRIQIQLSTANSSSSSQTASIILDNQSAAFLTYDYVNEPKTSAISTMHIHRGTARHKYQVINGKELFDGDYYTGRDRNTTGMLHFER